ncbi:hypothetical protein BGZ68_002983 [Mortierella alpina]|nr:hypothetical protein BGZ68_002983 [Mortierella alpina]
MASNSSTATNSSRTKTGKHKQDATDSKSDQAVKRKRSSRNKKDTQADTHGTDTEVASEASTGSSHISELVSEAAAASVPGNTAEKTAIQPVGEMSSDKAGDHQSSSLVNATALNPLKPIVVIPEQHPDRVMFPYGNYPTYYEKRSQEQTNPKTKGKQDAASLANANKAASSNMALVRQQTKPPKWRQEEQYPKSRHSSNRGLSVLLPPDTSSHDRSSNASGSRGEDSMAVRDLAKQVDLRLEFLEPSWFRGKRVLDIGCNAALLSVFIGEHALEHKPVIQFYAMHYKPCKIQGVDIDPSLIVKAEKFVRQTYSQISPQAYTQQVSAPSARKQSQDETLDPQEVPYESYFPKALQLMHGWLPIPKKTERTEALFPHNIEFRVADWVTEMAHKEENDLEQWDVIIGFSLTKWIHLHHGDQGIKRFFQDVYKSLAPGGLFLVEPQAYSTYNRRCKILPKMKEHYDAMTFMPDHFRDYLLSDEVGFREGVLLGHSEGNAKNFNRDIYSFRK